MSRNVRNVRGPSSALSSYLAAHNISARQILEDNRTRRSSVNGNNTTTSNAVQDIDEEEDEEEVQSTAAARRVDQDRKRKKQAEAISKIKKSKRFKRTKDFNGNDDDEDDDLALSLYNAGDSVPQPGQLENCELCKKRFTVTPYSRAGPNGGLLCPKCGKKVADDEKDAKQNTKKKAASGPIGQRRRKHQSRILDGQLGVKPLMTLCVETLANNVALADDLGDLPPVAIDRISRQLSKRRLLNPGTLPLFLNPQLDELTLYDAALLGQDDLIRIFQVCSSLQHLKLRNAIQFKDDVMEYLMGRNLTLESLYLHGANLLTEEYWEKYLEAKGEKLKHLSVYFTDKHFNDKIVCSLKDSSPDLVKLKICHNQEVSKEGVSSISHLKKLQHLSLQLLKEVPTEVYAEVINSVGENLRTLSLRGVSDVDDRLLDAIHDKCRHLSKLRITHSEVITDAGFVRLFKGWKNKSLVHIDLELCRHVDSENPKENPHKIGLCSDGFQAIMKHSASTLRKLNIHGCRHISREAFEEAFSVENVYPQLTDMEISFCSEVNDFIVGSIFRSCPNLRRLNVFGCMKVKDVRVPRGKILVGVPNAMGMIIEGTEE
ncbi:hypothetical protein M426DRAFT_118648 [Hypoxylon sp. CI-4A]|nr:hypothetical protein M426DRAFT_118648 [Hypoxylon sp. CI-4A]